jgi:hypothetical protein
LLLRGGPAALRVGAPAPLPASSPALLDWAGGTRDYPQALLAAGALRLAGHFEQAEQQLRGEAPAEWQAARANEVAALAWHRGEGERAFELWQAQEARVPVLFNRGMAALFLDRPGAREALAQAVAGLPENSAWHHLGQLYLTLASARGE